VLLLKLTLAVLAILAVSAYEAVASGDKVVALSATEAEATVPLIVPTKSPSNEPLNEPECDNPVGSCSSYYIS
jgi:hypothetical protein